MAQAIVTSQLMNLHYGRLKDQGRLSPVQVISSMMRYTHHGAWRLLWKMHMCMKMFTLSEPKATQPPCNTLLVWLGVIGTYARGYFSFHTNVPCAALRGICAWQPTLPICVCGCQQHRPLIRPLLQTCSV